MNQASSDRSASYLSLEGVEFPGALGKSAMSAPALRLASTLKPGCHCAVMQSNVQSDALIQSCSGLQLPLGGTVRLNGSAPYFSPRTRSQIVSLQAEEFVTEQVAGKLKVQQLAQQATAQWRSSTPLTILSLFERGPLAAFRDRSVASLDNHEKRIVMLELALQHQAPRLALLFEPWSVIQPISEEPPERRLLLELNRLVELGCIVLLVTVSQHQAERYSSQIIHPVLTRSRSKLNWWRSL
jgi:ABC-type cobalamin/Fe3+-siderophores transport system ATPase subunit